MEEDGAIENGGTIVESRKQDGSPESRVLIVVTTYGSPRPLHFNSRSNPCISTSITPLFYAVCRLVLPISCSGIT